MSDALFDPARHVPVSARPWDPGAARAAIGEIVADAVAAFDPEALWRSHPQEDGMPDGITGLYVGASGMLWALEFLRSEGAADHSFDVAAQLPALLTRNRAQLGVMLPMFQMEANRASWLFGELPILLMMTRAKVGEDPADDLHAKITGALELPILELMWGAAGAMLASVFASEITGEARWRALFEAMAARMLAEIEETPQGPLWTQAMPRRTARFLGPVHGYAGNIAALLAGWDWLTDAQQDRVREVVPATLAGRALHGPEGVNWPPVAEGDARLAAPLVQYCHGAAGMVTALADPRIASPELTELLKGGGELTWRAGPLAKGSNLCHGTGGNGFAFLKLHALTGEEIWRDRALAFAMTAIEQCRATRAEVGRGRYTLWTGDIGLAAYLHECLRGSARFPTIDAF